MSGVFESINLQSTAVVKPHGFQDIDHNNLHSDAESNSDDDPAELLLYSSSPSLQIDNKIPEDQFFLNPSRILADDETSRLLASQIDLRPLQAVEPTKSVYQSITFPKQATLHQDESPLEFLTNKNKVLLREINKNLALHKSYLQTGDDKLARVRSMLAQNFEQISENYYSLNEQYLAEISRTEELLTSFELWDKRRDVLLLKIRGVKQKSKHALKLRDLMDASDAVDDEIDALEQRLRALREKKKALASEIDTTSLVVESRAARYVGMFNNLEVKGKHTILDYLRHSNANGDDAGFLRTTPVDVDIRRSRVQKKVPTELTSPINQIPQNLPKMSDETSNQRSEASNNKLNPKSDASNQKSDDASVQSNNKPLPTSSQPRAFAATEQLSPTSGNITNDTQKPSLGMQPYTLPDNEDYNHGHGPTAYERGYLRGKQLSVKMVHRIGEFLQHLKNPPQSPVREASPINDEHANTVTEKIDLEPIVHLLDHKISAVGDLVLHTSTKATIFHQYGVLWKDVVNLMDAQEKLLMEYMSASRPVHNDPELAKILTTTLSQIKLCIENMLMFESTLSQDFLFGSPNPLYLALAHEIAALFSAMYVLGGLTPNTSEFVELGFVEDDIIDKETMTEVGKKKE